MVHGRTEAEAMQRLPFPFFHFLRVRANPIHPTHYTHKVSQAITKAPVSPLCSCGRLFDSLELCVCVFVCVCACVCVRVRAPSKCLTVHAQLVPVCERNVVFFCMFIGIL